MNILFFLNFQIFFISRKKNLIIFSKISNHHYHSFPEFLKSQMATLSYKTTKFEFGKEDPMGEQVTG
jgi:hypothetical protein